MPALTIARTETGASVDTSFSALDNLLASTVSSSFVVPSGVSAIKHVQFGVATDDVTESCTMLRLSGNGMADGEQYVAGPSMNTIGTSTGAFNGTVSEDVDFKVIPGNSIELAAGATATITAEVSAVIYLA